MRKLCCYLAAAVIVFTTFSNLQAQKKAAGSAAGSSNAPSSSATSSTPAASSSAAIESQMLAFGGLDDIANAVAFETCTNIFPNGSSGDRTVVIFDQASFANIQAYQGFLANAAALKSLYYSLLQTDEYQDVSQCRSRTVSTRSSLFPDSEEAKAQKQKKDRAQAEVAEADAKRAAKCAEVEKQFPGQPCLEPKAIGLSSTIDPFSDATSLLQAIAVSSNSESPGSIVIPDSAMAVAFTNQMRQQCGAPWEKTNNHLPAIIREVVSIGYFNFGHAIGFAGVTRHPQLRHPEIG